MECGDTPRGQDWRAQRRGLVFPAHGEIVAEPRFLRGDSRGRNDTSSFGKPRSMSLSAGDVAGGKAVAGVLEGFHERCNTWWDGYSSIREPRWWHGGEC